MTPLRPRRLCAIILGCLLPWAGGATREPTQPIEAYLRFAVPPHGQASWGCGAVLNWLATDARWADANCTVMRGALQVFRLQWKEDPGWPLREWLANQQTLGVLLRAEFRGDGMQLQSLEATTMPVGPVDYASTLQPAPATATEPDFVDAVVLRARSLLTVYTPAQTVTVAVIDSGVDIASSLLADTAWRNTLELPGNGLDDDGNGYVDDQRGWDFVTDAQIAEDAADPLRHGTAVASIISATAGSDAPAWLRIMSLRVASGGSGAGSVSPFALAEAIHYAVANGAQLINISVGSVQSFEIVQDAITLALARGVRVVVSAGNSGAEVLFPANMPGVVAVGALTVNGSIWSGSARGSGVDLYAPGTDMLRYLPGRFTGLASSGTSFAAPVVTGLSAMLLAVTGQGTGCNASRSLLLRARPPSQRLEEWLGRMIDHLELELLTGARLPDAWQRQQPICAAQLTVASLLRQGR